MKCARRSKTDILFVALGLLLLSMPVLRGHAAEWLPFKSGINTNLNGICGVSDNNMVAVGNGGVILRFDGASWSPMQSGTTANLLKCYAHSDTSFTAVAVNLGIPGATVTLGYDGNASGQWVPLNTGIFDGGSNVWNDWIVRGRNAIHFDGTAWQQSTFEDFLSVSLDAHSPLNDVGGVSGGPIVMPASTANLGKGGIFVNQDEVGAFESIFDGQGRTFLSAYGVASDDIFVGGVNEARRYQGGDIAQTSNWVTIPFSNFPLNTALSIWGLDANNMYAAGGMTTGYRGRIIHYDGNPGNVWTESLATFPELNDIVGTASGNLYAVGDSGAIYHFAKHPEPGTAVNVPSSGWATNQVNAYTRELVKEVEDVNLGGVLALYFSRYYASGLDRDGYVSAGMGNNWSHNYAWRIARGEDQGVETASVISPHGLVIRFSKDNSSGLWQLVRPLDTPFALIENAANFAFIDPIEGLLYNFHLTSGLLLRIEDRNGNALIISQGFDGVSRVQSGTNGRILDFQYDTEGRLSRIFSTAFSSTVGANVTREVTYNYDSDDNLTSFVNVGGYTTTYLYDAAHTVPGLLTGQILPELNQPWTWEYDPQGKVISQADANSSKTSIFPASGTSPTTVLNPQGRTRRLVHNGQGQLVTEIDEAGNSTQMSYDTEGHRDSVTNRIGGTRQRSYDPVTGKVTVEIQPDGNTVTTQYKQIALANGMVLHKPEKVTYHNGDFETYEYNATGDLTAWVDVKGERWTYTRNSRGQITSATMPSSGSLIYTYINSGIRGGLLWKIDDGSNNPTVYGYDEWNRLTSVIRPNASTGTTGSLTQAFTYNELDIATSVKDENNDTISFSYDKNGRLKTVNQPLFVNPLRIEYDEMGLTRKVTDMRNGVITPTHDALGRISRVVDQNNISWQIRYDPAGRPARYLDGAGNQWQIDYTAEGVLSRVLSPEKREVVFDSSDNMMGRYSSISNTVFNSSQSFDARGRVTGAVTNGRIFSSTPDASGRIVARNLPQGVAASYQRDEMGQIQIATDPNLNNWSYDYDALGKLSVMSDPLGNTTIWEYDARRFLNRITLPGTMGIINNTYTPAGSLGQVAYPDGTTIDFAYDEHDRLVSTNGVVLDYDDAGNLVQHNGITAAYDPGDRLETMTFAPGRTITYNYYTDRNLLESITDWTGLSTTFMYDKDGQLTDIVRSNGVSTVRKYDPAGLLAGITEGALASINITRNNEGLIQSEARNVPSPASVTPGISRSYSFDAASQVSGFSHDELGRLLNDGSRSFVWDAASRLKQVNLGGAVDYAYDGFNMPVSRTAGGQTTDYAWNSMLGMPSVSVLARGGQDIYYYVHTPDGKLLYAITPGGSRIFYHYDQAGNTLFLTNDSGVVIATYAYSPYGEVLSESGSIENPFTFGGENGVIRDTTTGLYNMRRRWYDPETARFVSREPEPGFSPGKLNPYAYALGNPLRYGDPTGLMGDENDNSWLDLAGSVINVIGQGLEKSKNYLNDKARQLSGRAARFLIDKAEVIAGVLDDASKIPLNPFDNNGLHVRRAASGANLGATRTLLDAAERNAVRAAVIDDLNLELKAGVAGGLLATATEDRSLYRTKLGKVIGSIGVGVVSIGAGASGTGTALGLVDAGSSFFFEKDLGITQVLNNSARVLVIPLEDVYLEGTPLGGSTRRWVDKMKEWGTFSRGIAELGEDALARGFGKLFFGQAALDKREKELKEQQFQEYRMARAREKSLDEILAETP